MIPRRTVLSVQPVAERGGSDQALLRLARQLGQAGWAVHVALPESSPMAAELTSVGVTMHVLPMRRISTSHGLGTWLAYLAAWPVSVVRLWRLARYLRADVVHTNSLHSWYGWAAAWLARKPHIWHAREIVVQSSAALRLERFLAQHFAQRVLAVSAAVASQLDPRNVIVVHEEADPAEFFPGRAGRAREAFGLPDDALVVGYVGRIDTWKGVDVLLEALPQLRRERELAAGPGGARTEVVVAGGTVADKEDYAESLAARARALGVYWLGPLPGPVAGDLIADLDCLVYPSTEPEPWGLVLVEALASGTPAVGTDAGGAREILGGLPAEAGLLVPPRDPAALATAIASLLAPSTSTELRRARPVLRTGEPAPYPELFEAVAAAPAGKPSNARR
ncbi:MAG TPA: glycosyltransferase family 4 protein [Acidimicrobiales bacterium]|nr:glycosyltransferase family 4 protein [Acidimicrobiales bacterium]